MNKKTTDESSGQTIEQLRARFETLERKRIQIETQLESANHQLSELKAEAVKQFGTDDVDELKRILARQEEENAAKLSAYQAELDSVENELSKIENDEQIKEE